MLQAQVRAIDQHACLKIYRQPHREQTERLFQLPRLHPERNEWEWITNMIQESVSSASSIVSHDVAAFLRILHQPGAVFEVRSVKCPDRKGGTYLSTAAGYFADADTAAKAIDALERFEPPAIYCTLNPINSSLIARAANRINHKADKTTNDADATGRQWLFCDIDSKRPSGVSATDHELDGAGQLSDALLEAMRSRGWPEPLQCMSGNGRYLLWRIDLPNDDASRDLVKAVLLAFANEFNTDLAEVDCSTFNAARIIKVAGTIARKGDQVVGMAGIDDRPHRQSWFIPPDKPLEVVPRELLEVAAGVNAEPEEKSSQKIDATKVDPSNDGSTTAGTKKSKPASSSGWNIDQWLIDHNVPVSAAKPYKGGRKWLFTALPRCCESHGHPFDNSSCIIEMPSGALGASCQHAHCTWDWRELREAYEPDAYQKPKADVSGIVGGSGGGNGGELKEMPPEVVADEFLETQRLGDVLTLRNWSGSYWKWLGGRYVEITKEDVKGDLVRFLRRRYS
ncbi:MAG TPA: hypothetical protein DDZ51_02520, partial [Planctomycetaceae bacterium]|nr:hypothetical protein [Planctomycetaceae bacterium]